MAALLPEEEHLPEPNRMLVHFLKEVAVLGARELVALKLLLLVRVLFVEELQKLLVEHHLGLDLVDGCGSLEKLFQCFSTIF